MSVIEIENEVTEAPTAASEETTAVTDAATEPEPESTAEAPADEPAEKPTGELKAEAEEPEAPAEPEPGEAEADAPDAPEAEAAADAPDGEAKADADAKPAKKERRGRPRTKLDDLVVGTQTKGKVVGLAKFGCFVDIGAVTDGLVHVTEFPSKRVREISDEVQSGDEVEVWIKDVDTKTNRISLSMRKKPQRSIRELKAGDVLSGTVTSVTKYGAFVDIASDTEGLVHISEMSSGYVERPSEIVNSGEAVEVKVKEIDLERGRISLSMVGLANDTGLGAEPEGSADEAIPDEPEEKMPTVVELALRRALGDMQDEAEEAAEADVPDAEVADDTSDDSDAGDDADDDAAGSQDSLGEVYERMLEEYRAAKTED